MSKINFAPFPELKTNRLILRQLKEEDNHKIFLLRSDDRVNRYIDRTKPKDIAETSDFILKINNGIKQNEWIYWAITLKDNPILIGTICLWNFSEDKTGAELGYELDPAFQGKGIMSETLKKIIEFGFQEIELDAIDAYTHKNNNNSTILLQKHNFKLDEKRKDKENSDNIIFMLTKQNWIKTKPNK